MSLLAEVDLTVGRFRLDLTLAVEAGEVVAVLGPNGSGKSTLLRALAGLQPLDDGRIELDGQVLDDPAAGIFVPPEERPVGVVFQSYLLFPHLSALDNVAFGLRRRGVPRRVARRTRRGSARPRRPGRQGGRQTRRAVRWAGPAHVPLARAVVTEPAMLLLDEPLSALDVGRGPTSAGTWRSTSTASRVSGSSSPMIRSTPSPSPTTSSSSRTVGSPRPGAR